MTDPLLTADARAYVSRALSAIVGHAGLLDRRFAKVLRGLGYNPAQVRAFLMVTPAAASRLGSLGEFLEQVEYHGRRLAKLNIQPDAAKIALKAFGPLLESVLPGQFGPAREQLHLATVLGLHDAFYQVREAETQALFGLYRAEVEAVSPDDLLRLFVRILTRTFHARAGRLLLLDGPPRGKLSRPLYIRSGDPREALLADPQMRGRYGSYWSFPIEPAALLQFGFSGPYPWLPRELTLLHAVAGRCREALEKVRLQAHVRRLEVEARKAEEDERRRIGRELHDEAVQSLALLRLQLELMERDADSSLRPRLAEARATVAHTTGELRRIVAALSPAVLERLGLGPAIRQLAVRSRKTHAAEVRVRIAGAWEAVSRQSSEVIYRVAQESLQNIAKHSQASRVNLLLQSTDKKIRLSISDNGVGFRLKAASDKPMSFGLAGMQERAALLQGKLTIRTAPGKGVRVLLELPQNSMVVK